MKRTLEKKVGAEPIDEVDETLKEFLTERIGGMYVNTTLWDSKENPWIAITITVDTKRWPSYDPREQYKCMLNMLLLRGLDKVLDYFCFVPELHASGNIHLHGVYVIKDTIKYFRSWLPFVKRFGHVILKHRVDINWLGYMCKSQDLMKEIMSGEQDNLPVIIDYLHYDEYDGLRNSLNRPCYTLHMYNMKRPVKRRFTNKII